MSRKHHQRSRAEILAKRARSIAEVPVRKNVGSALVPLWKVLPTHAERLRADFAALKYLPHFGAKQQAKLQPRGC